MTRSTLRTGDDVLLSGRRWSVRDARAAVVLVHGFSASSAHPEVEATATALQGAGYEVVSFDARGHGASGGWSTLGDLERHDVAAAVEVARRHAPRVVLVGASMGAIAALRHATGDPDLAGVVSVSCPAAWRLPRNPHGLLAVGLTRTPMGRAFMARFAGIRVYRRWTRAEEPARLVERLRVPLAVIHGTDDRFIRVSDAHELFARAGDPRRIDVIPGMGHAFHAASLPAVVAGVEWSLTQAPARSPS